MRGSVLPLPLVLVLLLVGLTTGRATPNAEMRIALVIGNAAYTSAPLKNPVNDARDMAAALRSLGLRTFIGFRLVRES
ncbi:MAG: caspase family protein [Humidesulfovibrio sp.]|nr:caspase family protein [Humidesulfovibrio sp.]